MSLKVPAPSSALKTPPDGGRAHWGLYALVGLLALYVLVRGAFMQIFDTNFYTLWEATSLLAGDVPYRDFYEWGVPLQAVVSAAAQVVSGNRLIGELAVHWLLIVLSVVLSFHLALGLSRSVAASLIAVCVMLPILAPTPTFHYAKFFVYPIAVYLCWIYMRRPSAATSAVLGAMTAAAFLYRHDHGIYVGLSSVVAFGLARVTVPASARWRSSIRDAGVYTAVAAVILVPWAVAVQMHEGLVDYVGTRAQFGRMWEPSGWPFLRLRDFNPGPVLAGVASSLAGSAAPGGADPSWLPGKETARQWLMQITILLPVLVLMSAGLETIARLRRRERPSTDTCRTLLATAVAVIVGSRLLREVGYFVVLLPLTAAFAAYVLAPRGVHGDGQSVTLGGGWHAVTRAWRMTRQALAVVGLVVTVIAVLGFSREVPIFSFGPDRPGFPLEELMSSPPIDAFEPADAARRIDRAEWIEIDRDIKQKIMMRYMHDCTRDGDRLLVTGSTPFQVGYYVNRPIAGGHLFWHHRWRADPAHEMQSLTLISRQSVPFAFSTHDPILEDFEAYPAIHRYLTEHYAEIEGSGGLLLVDTRRRPTGQFGMLGFPCFR